MYPPVFEPNKLIHVMDSLDSQMAESLMPHLVGARPNTYTFTKSIAEALVASYGMASAWFDYSYQALV